MKIKKLIPNILATGLLLTPLFALAASDTSLIVCNGPDCNFASLIKLGQNFINFLIYLAFPIAAISFAWAGWLILTAGGNAGQVAKGKAVFQKVGTGLIFMLVAWLIVKLILDALLNSADYSLLQQSS